MVCICRVDVKEEGMDGREVRDGFRGCLMWRRPEP